MEPRFLFPHALKKVGLLLIVLSVLLYVLFTSADFHKYFYSFTDGDKTNFTALFRWLENYVDEIISVVLITGLLLVAFSKEKTEDEWVSKIRLQSLQLSMYINSVVILVAIIFFYSLDFVDFMAFNLFTMLIFFVIHFHYVLYLKPILGKRNQANAF